MSSYHVLLVPGSWHVPAHYESTIVELKKRGIDASTLLHPTIDLSHARIDDLAHPDLANRRPADAKPWPDMTADAANIRQRLTQLVEQGQLVLLVPHSYGGLPSSEALLPELSRRERKAAGKQGGVIGILAVASFFLPVGVSTRMAMGGTPLPTTPEQPSGLHVIIEPGKNLFSDLPLNQREHWISLLRPQSWLVHETPASNAGFLNVPCGFLKTTKDVMTPIQGQEMGIAAARSMGADVTEFSIDSDHVPFLGHTEETVDSIVAFGKKCAQAEAA